MGPMSLVCLTLLKILSWVGGETPVLPEGKPRQDRDTAESHLEFKTIGKRPMGRKGSSVSDLKAQWFQLKKTFRLHYLGGSTVACRGNFLLSPMKWSGERGKQRWTPLTGCQGLGQEGPGWGFDLAAVSGGQRADSRRGGQLGIKAGPVVGRTKAETARKLADNDMWGGREGGRAAQPLQPTRL